MFSFSAYAGGIAAAGGSVILQVMGSVVSAIGIFLPGTLLIYFIYPVWEDLKKIKGISVSLNGITAVAGGLIVTTAIILIQKTGIEFVNILVVLSTVFLLLTKKVPAPIIVVIVLIFGIVI